MRPIGSQECWRAGPKMRSLRHTGILAAALLARLLFKGTALVGGLVLIAAVWFWDASLLTKAADENLLLVRAAASLLPADWASKAESALRIFGADRALLLTEAIAVAKLVMLGFGYPFRRLPR